MSEPVKLPVDDLVRAAERELSMRRRVYPKWVAGGKMTEATADHEIRAMSQIVDTLVMLKRFEAPIRDAVLRRLQDLRDFELHPAVDAVRDAFPDAEIIIHDLPSETPPEERPDP